jgi:uncharacterized protein YndB with AHSA1/START domain
MNDQHIAEATINVRASVEKVWEALTDPGIIRKYIFGTTVTSDWKEGSTIIWKGEWQGKTYQDKGQILKYKRNQLLQYSHYSAMSGQADVPESYHTVTITLTPDIESTKVFLTQDNNPTREAKEHSQKNWNMMLASLKTEVEK